MTRKYVVTPAADRFWPKVNAHGVCWEWTGAKNSKGYGNFWDGERTVQAHRWAYEELVGPPPLLNELGQMLVLDHLCRNTVCVNPDHLELVTQSQNVTRGRKGIRLQVCKSGRHSMAGSMRQCRQCQSEANRRRYLRIRYGANL